MSGYYLWVATIHEQHLIEEIRHVVSSMASIGHTQISMRDKDFNKKPEINTQELLTWRMVEVASVRATSVQTELENIVIPM